MLSADDKTSTQARKRKHPALAPTSGRPIYVEHEYARCGAWAYIAAWDVHRAKLFVRCERKTGIAPFERLVTQVMRQEPYRSARRVFWIVDNGSSHRGQPAIDRLKAKWPNIVLVHTPVHASWLNQIETYFSIVQRKVLTPNDFPNLKAVKERLISFQKRYQTCKALPTNLLPTRPSGHARKVQPLPDIPRRLSPNPQYATAIANRWTKS